MAVVMIAVKVVNLIVKWGSQKKEKNQTYSKTEKGQEPKLRAWAYCERIKGRDRLIFHLWKIRIEREKSGSRFHVSTFYDSNTDIERSNKTNTYYGSSILYIIQFIPPSDQFVVMHQVSLAIMDISMEKFEKHFSTSSCPSAKPNNSPSFLILLLPWARKEQGLNPTVYCWIHSTHLAYLAGS